MILSTYLEKGGWALTDQYSTRDACWFYVVLSAGFCFTTQGLITLRMVRTEELPRAMSARMVMGVLADIWDAAADNVGKIRIIDDPKVGTDCCVRNELRYLNFVLQLGGWSHLNIGR